MTQATERWTITVAVEQAIIGYNGEYADMDNPRGAIFADRWYLQATRTDGERRRSGSFVNQAEAEASIPFAAPVDAWEADYPEYGSAAYLECEPMLVEMERAADRDGGCFLREPSFPF